MRRFGLIGYPLSHSFSPAYFAKKFADEGILDCRYDAFPIRTIDELSLLLNDTPELKGLNVTIPYKKQIIPFLHESSNAVKEMDACNCIKIENGKLTGYNTDVTGFEKSLLPKLNDKHISALILGTGGAASAVEYVLKKLSISYLFVSRKSQANKSMITYNDVTSDLLNNYKLIVNTTPIGMFPDINEAPDIPYETLTTEHYLYDLVYNPAETLFLKNGAENGAIIKNGADMLIIQAEESWRIWNEV